MRRRLLAAILAVLVSAGIGVVLVPSPALAAPNAPAALSPNGSSVASNPVLSWTRVGGAASYRVELSQSGSFDSLDYSTTTKNRYATPTAALPSGQLSWRVRAVDVSGGVSSWSTASFTLNPKAAPAQLSPGDGAPLPQPQEPPLLEWGDVNGAASYEVAYGTDPNLSTSKSVSTKTTSYAFPTPQAQAVYYWQVRAVLGNGQATEWSGIRSYEVESLAQPQLNSPNNSPDTVVADAVLDWHSVPGASKYEVRVSNDDAFTTVSAQATTVATRWSPPVTLNNDEYWWQVRAYDSQGQTKNWAELEQTWQFERRWQFEDTTTLNPERPVLVYPADGVAPVTNDPFFYEWKPVRLGSEYKLQVGTDANFSPKTFVECSTKQTTFTPANGLMRDGSLGCQPGSAGTYYWRVQAVDQPKPVLTPWSDIRSFSYRPGSVSFSEPADGATVAVPTMKWSQAYAAERYRLTYSYGTVTPKTVTTYSTSYTPTTSIPAGTPTVTWSVQAIYANGDLSAKTLLGGTRTFTVGAPPEPALAPDALSADSAGDRFPSLSWNRVTGASHYKVFVGTAGTGSFTELSDKFVYSAGTDTTATHLGSRTYDWFVQAYSSSTVKIGDPGSTGSYTIQNVGSVAGQEAAHTGTELDTPLRCRRSLSDGDVSDVCYVQQTPVLDWDPVVGASSYTVTLARDKRLTNKVSGYPRTTHNTRWTPTDLLPDSQAGQAYYWVVRPCKSPSVCGPDPTEATNVFDKTSHPVTLSLPPENVPPADALTFAWTDYLDTNITQTAAARSRVEARQYRVEVSTSPTFQTILDTATVDQTTFTGSTKTYPEGALFWRVSALDGSSNTVGTSAVQELTKESLAVNLRSPINGSTNPGTPALRWEPRAFTASYDVEVYKNNDANFSTTNRVLTTNSRLSAYSFTTPLPAAQLAYVWRVRSRDVSGNPGPWSGHRTFTVRGTAPTQRAPLPDARVSATASLFVWSSVQGASSYRFERRPSGGTTATETVNTVGLAWAPTSQLPNGTSEWRVSSVDSAGRVVATSPWRTFRVDALAPTVTVTRPTSSAKPGTNVAATFSEPVKGVTTGTMQLYLEGRAHPVSATVSRSADKLRAVLNPAVNLRVGRSYRAVLTSGITDLGNNPLVRREWTFTVVR